jgi:hypothetical protein
LSRSVFRCSAQLGNYNYITRWTFNDDGAVEPSMGFTGRLQTQGLSSAAADAPFGTLLSSLCPPSRFPGIPQLPAPCFGINHVHNVYWRFDLDIGGSANNPVDRIITNQEIAGPPSSTDACLIFRECQTIQFVRFSEKLTIFWIRHSVPGGSSTSRFRTTLTARLSDTRLFRGTTSSRSEGWRRMNPGHLASFLSPPLTLRTTSYGESAAIH